MSEYMDLRNLTKSAKDYAKYYEVNDKDVAMNAFFAGSWYMEKWIPIDEFKLSSYEGLCWISYKGKVVESYYFDGKFRFHRHSMDCYLTECINAVMLIDKPEYP